MQDKDLFLLSLPKQQNSFFQLGDSKFRCCSALAGTNALAIFFVGRIVITKCLILSTENKKFKFAFLEHEIL